MADVDKIIITNQGALARKYAASGLAAIRKAIDRLIAADAKRGLNSKFIALDDVAAMKAVGGAAVKQADNPKQNKAAVDAIYRALTPDYLLLLGAIDVIPHQDLRNPLYSEDSDGDTDEFAWGDIPYACEAPHSRDASKFVGPTRVVGRLPDITGGDDPSYLVGLLDIAAGWKQGARKAIANYFAISAEVWDSSTRLSVSNVFGAAAAMQSAPPKKRPWTTAQLKQPMHFFNCHGADRSPQFYGQSVANPNDYPVALEAKDLNGKVKEGAVIAAECCYGGQLYASGAADMGVANTYLKNKAYGMLASTTIAYGPATGNGSADLICQYFLSSVLSGASLGRAALEARQRFVRRSSPLDPADRKTLAQFNLYGDPSIQPVYIAKSRVAPKFASKAKTLAAPERAERVARHDRRRKLMSEGFHLSDSEPGLIRTEAKAPRAASAQLQQAAQADGLAPGEIISFDVKKAPGAAPKFAKALVAHDAPEAFHVLVCKANGGERPARKVAKSKAAKGVRKSLAAPAGAEAQRRPPSLVLWVGKEVNGELVSVTKLHSH